MSDDHLIEMSSQIGRLTGVVETHVKAQGDLNDRLVRLLEKHEANDKTEHDALHKRISRVKRLVIGLGIAGGTGATAASGGPAEHGDGLLHKIMGFFFL